MNITQEINIEELAEKLEKYKLLKWRGISVENVCSFCEGTGYITYGSTATYFGGIGGAAMTRDTCSRCWGSGDQEHPWPNLKELIEYRNRQEKYNKKRQKMNKKD